MNFQLNLFSDDFLDDIAEDSSLRPHNKNPPLINNNSTITGFHRLAGRNLANFYSKIYHQVPIPPNFNWKNVYKK